MKQTHTCKGNIPFQEQSRNNGARRADALCCTAAENVISERANASVSAAPARAPRPRSAATDTPQLVRCSESPAAAQGAAPTGEAEAAAAMANQTVALWEAALGRLANESASVPPTADAQELTLTLTRARARARIRTLNTNP